MITSQGRHNSVSVKIGGDKCVQYEVMDYLIGLGNKIAGNANEKNA